MVGDHKGYWDGRLLNVSVIAKVLYIILFLLKILLPEEILNWWPPSTPSPQSSGNLEEVEEVRFLEEMEDLRESRPYESAKEGAYECTEACICTRFSAVYCSYYLNLFMGHVRVRRSGLLLTLVPVIVTFFFLLGCTVQLQ